MKYEVLFTKSAEDDLTSIYEYVFVNDLPSNAEKLIDNLQKAIPELERFPKRGHIPVELERINVSGFLEIHYKPYKIFYQVFNEKAYIHFILDSRRNLAEILQRRLIR
jgi:toxin ParE1/3/4